MIRVDLTLAIQSALQELGLNPDSDFSLEQPANPEHGSWASNVALVNADKAQKSPRDLALQLSEILNRDQPAHILRAEVAGPGFLNLHLKNDWLYEVLSETLNLGEADFSRHSFGKGQKILLEFVSANPTGPLHVGHAKGAIFGDTLARVLAHCGYKVEREFYINDLGAQVDLYTASLIASLQGEPPPADGYMGSYIKKWSEELGELESSSGETFSELDRRNWGLQKAQNDQAKVLEDLDIHFDNWVSESSICSEDQVEKILKSLSQESMTYENEGALWLKSSTIGDDKDRVLIKSDGSLTYLLPDIAYHQVKLNKADRVINVWGADHHGYVARLRVALSALGEAQDRLEIIICQLVHLERDGEEVKVSKRTGDIILLQDLIEELGRDVVRFTFLLQSVDTTQTIDLQKAAAKSMENPVYYVQYAHTRICSIIQKQGETKITGANLSLLSHPSELELLKILANMPEVVAQVAKESAPHRLASYLRELAGAFHGFYHNCRVVGDDIDPELSNARGELVRAVQIGLKVGLNLCGVNAPEKM